MSRAITRGQLGNIISSNTPTKTLHMMYIESDVEITDDWEVAHIEQGFGFIVIYCQMTKAMRAKNHL